MGLELGLEHVDKLEICKIVEGVSVNINLIPQSLLAHRLPFLQIEEHLKMNEDGIRTRKELVLLWKEEFKQPMNTFNWLKGSWFSGHFHVRADPRMFRWSWNVDEQEVVRFYEENVFVHRADFNSDFARLGRCLTGNAVGLVLGGGGARGAAHIGIIKAIQEHGIPVDIVGGTSIGSMIGGIFAENPRGDLEAKARSWFQVSETIFDIFF